MKFVLAFVFLIAAPFTVARVEVRKNDLWWQKEYKLHRDPLDDEFTKFDTEAAEVETKYIVQKLDHFNPQDNRTWNMRYMENRNYTQAGGPIFIYVGGEWTISAGSIRTGHTHDMTRNLSGIVYYTEHRYYGASWPTQDLTIENLKFLTVDQALADLAYFITYVKETDPLLKDSGVILVGGSYSATMVTWFLQKYPHLANGAWSSSAPLEAKVNFVEYKEVVSDAIHQRGGEKCSSRIRSAFEELEALYKAGNTSKIEEIFYLCYPLDLTNELDVWNFFGDASGGFSGIVQYHREYSQNIQRNCEVIVNHPSTNDLEAYVSWWWFGNNPPNPEDPFDQCFDHRYFGSDSFADYLREGTEWDSPAGRSSWRQWMYQTCNEYGWYQASGGDILFGNNFPYNLSMATCHHAYGENFTPETIHSNADRINILYGAKLPNVRNVYSTHGQFDPWRPMGVQEDINEHSPTVILPLETHCADLGSIIASDSDELRASKERIFELSKKWLGLSP